MLNAKKRRVYENENENAVKNHESFQRKEKKTFPKKRMNEKINRIVELQYEVCVGCVELIK